MTAQSNPSPQSSSMLLFRLIMGGVGLAVLLCLLFILVGPILLSDRNSDFDYIPATRNRTLLAQLTSTKGTVTPQEPATKTLQPASTTPLRATAEIITPSLITESAGPTATFTYLPPTRVSPTATATVITSPTLEATDTPSPTATFAVSPEPSRTPRPTNTPRPSVTASQTTSSTTSASRTFIATQTASVTSSPSPSATPTNTIQASPTVLYSNGRPLRLLYNPSSFYVANPNNAAIEVAPLSFEALDKTGYIFLGNTWAQIYGTVEPNACVAIEIFGTQAALEPANCAFYNATVNPPTTSSTIFWTGQFAVFWNDVEIARCAIADGECLIFVP